MVQAAGRGAGGAYIFPRARRSTVKKQARPPHFDMVAQLTVYAPHSSGATSLYLLPTNGVQNTRSGRRNGARGGSFQVKLKAALLDKAL